MNKESFVSIFVKEMRVQVRIGLLEEEKIAPQWILVRAEMFTDLSYLKQISNDTIIDYAKIYNKVMGWQERDHVDLLETLAVELVEYCFEEQVVQALKISIGKPDIFEKADSAGVEIYTTREDWQKS